MEKFIKNIGKTFFWLSFILGNVCLFGYYISKDISFAFAGYMLLIYGSIINGVVFLGLILFGIFSKKYSKIAIDSALIMLINIPIATIYASIGLTFHY